MRVPSEGSRFVADSIINFNNSVGKSFTAKVGLGGAVMGLSTDEATQHSATLIQIFGCALDGTIDFVNTHQEAIKTGARVTAATNTAVLGILKVALNIEQGGPDPDRALAAACGALAIDVALAVACPPAGIGIIFCSVGLIAGSLNVMAAGRAWGAANEQRFRDRGAELRRQQWMNKVSVIAPTKNFYNFRLDPTQPRIWYL